MFPRALVLVMLFSAWSALAQMVPQKSGTTENLRGISAVSDTVAWASGTHGTYLRTIDGGSTWIGAQVPGAEALDFRDVEAFTSDVAYLLAAGPGDQSRIYKTSNAGRTWTLQFTNHDPKGFFDCMAFWDSDHGIALGDPVNGRFVLITTDDGGANWKQIRPDKILPAVEGEGAFAASGSCIAVQGNADVWFGTGGKVARVFHSPDRGQTWTVADTPIVHGSDSTGIFSIVFRDAHNGVAAGGDYKHPDQNGPNLAYTDDGATWKLSPLSPQSYFSAVVFASGRKNDHGGKNAPPAPDGILAVGSTGVGYADDLRQSSWTFRLESNSNALSASPHKIWAVGAKGLIVQITPGIGRP
jgi:photosystem II stability/assembly factor-like uncharacterized protein